MKHAVDYLKHNALAVVALFVALGGTSYAAVALPKDSVGSTQLRNGAVTSSKLHAGAVTPGKLGAGIGGRILYLAEIQSNGVVALSEPRGVTAADWSPGSGGFVDFPHKLPNDCLPIAGSATPEASGPTVTGPASVGIGIDGTRTSAQVAVNAAVPVVVEIICGP